MDDLSNLFLIILVIIIPIIAQGKVKRAYNKYSKINNSRNLTGKEVARMILDKNGLNNVSIEEIGGTLSDYYDPKGKNICLSNSIYNGTSISSVSVAAHECGHAMQDKEAYSFFTFRSKLVPIVNITSRISSIVVVLGFILEFFDLVTIGVILLCVGLLFQLVTLPVEFNASKRAKIQLQELGLIADSDVVGINKVLKAAALTYVAGFIAEILQVLRIILMSRRRR